MAIITQITTANTFAQWLASTVQLIGVNNDFYANNFTKPTGTLFLGDPTLGLQVNTNAIIAGQLEVSGTGSSAYVQNNLRVDGQVYFTNTSLGLVNSGTANIGGTLYAQASGTGLNVSNNVIIGGSTNIGNYLVVANTLTVDSGTDLNSTLNVVGTSNFQNAVTISGTTTISNNASITQNLDVGLNVTVGNLLQAYSAEVTTLTNTNTLLVGTNATVSNTLYTNYLQSYYNVNTQALSVTTNTYTNNLFANTGIQTPNLVATNTVYSTNITANNSLIAGNTVISPYINSTTAIIGTNITSNNTVLAPFVNTTTQIFAPNIQANTGIQTADFVNSGTSKTAILVANSFIQTATLSVTGNTNTNNLIANNSVTVPTIYATNVYTSGNYYDSTNTTYFLKPSGTSNLSALNVGGSAVVTNNGGSWNINVTGTSTNITQYSINQNLSTTSSPTFNGTTVNNLTVNTSLIANGVPISYFTDISARNITANNVQVQGNFVINGNTVYNSPIITLNQGGVTNQNGYLSVYRPISSSNATIRWNEPSQYWDILDVNNDSYYRILTNEYLDNTFTNNSSSNVASSLSVNNLYNYLQGIENTQNTNISYVTTYSQAAYNKANTGGTFSSGGNFNGTVNATNLTINSSQVLYAGNYNSYAPTLTGGGASGTWGINITGESQTANTLVWLGNVAENTTANGLVAGAQVFGVYNDGYPTSYGNVLTIGGQGYGQLLIGWSSNTGGIADNYIRSLRDAAVGTGSGWSNWAKIITDQNYNSYAPTLTGGGASGTWGINITGNASTTSQINFSNLTINGSQVLYAGNYNNYTPTLTGTGASGTWGISITGNAATASQASQATNATNVNGGSVSATSGTFSGNVQSGGKFLAAEGTTTNGGYSFTLDGAQDTGMFSPSDGDLNLYSNGVDVLHITPTGFTVNVASTFVNGLNASNLTINGNQVLDSANFNTYTPTLTGTGASGTWGINITGTASNITGTYSGTLTSSQITSGLGYTPVEQGGGTGQGTNKIYIGWLNGTLGVQVDSTNFSSTWPISINGNAATATSAASATLASKASTLSQGGGNGTAMTFNYAGQTGQPTWLWGTNDGVTIDVYNPSNFSVSYAASAGSASTATTASTANALNTGNSYTVVNFTTTSALFVGNNTGQFGELTYDGWLTLRNASNTNGIRFVNQAYNVQTFVCDDSGNVTAAGNVTAYSDARLKKNVQTITNPLQKVSNLRGVTFEKDGKSGLGVIAQEVREILPEVVQENENGLLSVAYGNIVGLLIESIKELKAEIDELKKSK